MRVLVVLPLALPLIAGHARADDGSSDGTEARDPDPIFVDARLDGTVAQLTLKWSIDVPQPGWTESQPTLPLPATAVATGATATVGGQSHRLVLQPADKAHAAFEDMIASEAPGPRGWAVGLHIADGSVGRIAVDIAAPRADHIALTLEATEPTCFFGDTRIVRVPARWKAMLAPALRKLVVSASPALDAACPWNEEDDSVRIALPSGELALRPVGDRRIDGLAMRLSLGDKDLARVELDLSSQISAVPPDLHTVFLLDTSRSITPGQAAVQRAVMESYMQHAPSTHVQALAFARRTTPLLPAWTIASQASPRIMRALENIPARNGSDIEVALAEAGRLLDAVDGTRRIVLFSDELLSARINQLPLVGLRRVVPPGTVIQVVYLTEEQGPLERYDDGVLASLATSTDGFEVSGKLDDKGHVDAKMLVRPITLDEITVRAPGWKNVAEDDQPACPAQIAEGQSCVFVGQGDPVAGPIAIEGLLWGRKFTRVLRPDPAQSRTLARILVADTTSFAEDVQQRIAELAEAVTSASGLFAKWGGTGGYGPLAEGTITGGTFGTSSSTDIIDGITGTVGHADVKIDLRAQFEHVIEACHASSYRVELDVETTWQEIVDVGVVVQSVMPDRSLAIRTCIAEGVWDTMLALPSAPEQQTVHLVY